MNEILSRAYDHGRAILTGLSVAQDCPSLRLEYLKRARRAAARITREIDAAIAAEVGEMPPAPGPSIRCNACRDPHTCPQCLALNEKRDAQFETKNARI